MGLESGNRHVSMAKWQILVPMSEQHTWGGPCHAKGGMTWHSSSGVGHGPSFVDLVSKCWVKYFPAWDKTDRHLKGQSSISHSDIKFSSGTALVIFDYYFFFSYGNVKIIVFSYRVYDLELFDQCFFAAVFFYFSYKRNDLFSCWNPEIYVSIFTIYELCRRFHLSWGFPFKILPV